KPQNAWEQALYEASKELRLPKTHFTVERMATLSLLLKVQRSQWAQGKLTNSGDMIEVMDAISALRKERGINDDHPTKIEVSLVERYIGIATCDTCGHRFEVSDQPFDSLTPRPEPAPASEPLTTDHGKPGAEPAKVDPNRTSAASVDSNRHSAASDAPANVVPMMKVTHREGVSASSFHSAVINGREVPPLKSQQPSHYYSAEHERERHPYIGRNGHKLPEVKS